MIIIKSKGQLGNQMFQYAFACAFSKKLDTFFLIDKIDHTDELYYFNLFSIKNGWKYTFSSFLYYIKLHVHTRAYQLLIWIFLHLVMGSRKKKQLINSDNWRNPAANLKDKGDNSIFNGFFQSSEYFADFKNNIHGVYKIKKKYINEFNEKFGRLFKENKTIVIQIRKGDYCFAGNDELGGIDLTLPDSFYKKALKKIPNSHDYKVIIIGDDAEYIRKQYNTGEYLFYSNSEILDLQFLINADILIIANSSFGWWGAFLNRKSHKIVFAPKYWLGFKVQKEYPVSVLENGWELIDPFSN